MTCQGHVNKTFSASQCYLDLCYAIATITCKENDDDLQFKKIREDLQYYIDHMDYSYINMNIFKQNSVIIVDLNVCVK